LLCVFGLCFYLNAWLYTPEVEPREAQPRGLWKIIVVAIIYHMRKTNFFNDGFYHIYNRGVLKQPIFFENVDYSRFVHNLYEFNDTNRKIVEVEPREAQPRGLGREPVVAIIAWCLMPNHFHLFVQQLKEGGVSSFMHKLGTGYTTFINKKYERSGHVFQGRFRAKSIDKENYFLHISRYIHLNPVEFIEPNWKKDGIKDWQKTQEFLERYKWSSYQDWIGKKNIPAILDLSSVKGMFLSVKMYKKFLREWADKKEVEPREVQPWGDL